MKKFIKKIYEKSLYLIDKYPIQIVFFWIVSSVLSYIAIIIIFLIIMAKL